MRWQRTAPWDEAYFLEGIDQHGTGWWFRWTLTHGEGDPQVGLWLARDDGRHPVGAHRRMTAEVLRAAPPVAGRPGGWIAGQGFWLSPDRAEGMIPEAGAAWALELHAGDAPYRMVPRMLELLRLGRTYEPLLPAVTFGGLVTFDGKDVLVQGRGTVGHVFGARNRLVRWVWTHAHIPEQEATIEVLSARLGGRFVRPLTTVFVRIGANTWTLSGLRDALRTEVREDGDTLHVTAGSDALAIELTWRLGSHPVVARYDGPDGAVHTCRNSTRCTLAVRVADRTRKVDRAVRTDRAIGEVGTHGPPDGDPTIPPISR